MAMIYYGWGEVLKHKQLIGYKYCEGCCGFQPYYLTKKVYRVHIMYIPIFMSTKGYYVCCKSCKRGTMLSKEEYRNLRYEYSPMKKSMSKKCFKDLCRLCDAIGECTEPNVEYVMKKLAETYPVTANDTLREHYREAVAMRLEMNEQMKRAQAHTQTQAPQPYQIPSAPAVAPSIPQTGSWTCSCGASNTTKFCADCGAQQPAPSATPATMQQTAPPQEAIPPTAVTVCPRCGKEDMNAPFFCSVCGSPMNAKR